MKEIVVYYSPYSNDESSNWDILYRPPQKVFDYLKPSITNSSKNYLLCPASNLIQKKCFRLINTLESEYVIEDSKLIAISKQHINAGLAHEPTLNNQALISLNYYWMFFTEEESLEMTLLPPFMEKSNHLEYGSVVSGTMDIGKYFRLINVEFNLWENNNYLKLEKDEAMAYVMFNTNYKIKLKRFYMTPRLRGYIKPISESSNWEPKVSIFERYKRFEQSRIKPSILKEIKSNLIDEEYVKGKNI